MRGPREVALLKFGLVMAQVLTHHLSLLPIGGILGDNALSAPVLGLREKMCVVAFRLRGITSAPRFATSTWRSASAAGTMSGISNSAMIVAGKRYFVMKI